MSNINVRFRREKDNGWQVRATYGNKSMPIYQFVDGEEESSFEPIKPWEGRVVNSTSHDPRSAWRQVRQKIIDKVYRELGSASHLAEVLIKTLGA